MKLSKIEHQYSEAIRVKLEALHQILIDDVLSPETQPAETYRFLTRVKIALGNFNNDLSFIATLMAKEYLAKQLDVSTFDAAAKAPGSPGIDIVFTTRDGKRVAGEVKTTIPYKPGFGANQREKIGNDIEKLRASNADMKFLFFTDRTTFEAARQVPAWVGTKIKVVLLPTGEEYSL